MNFTPQLGIGLPGDCVRRMPLLPTPPRWTQQRFLFLNLRSQEILRRLDATEHTEHHVFFFRAASDAATLAWQTDFPLLVFPELFRELADASLKHVRRQESIRDLGFKLLLATC